MQMEDEVGPSDNGLLGYKPGRPELDVEPVAGRDETGRVGLKTGQPGLQTG